jgi:hypothetical protein
MALSADLEPSKGSRPPAIDTLRAWARAHVPELAVFALGVLLRLSMALTYDARIGYDFVAHWPTIQWFVDRHELPPFDLNTASAHPPLYYVIAAVLVSAGLGPGALGWLAALMGISRLAIVWAALERWLPESRLARVVALATSAVLPTAVHLDGMITNEALGMLFGAIVLLLAPAAIRSARAGRIGRVVGLAFVLALALLTKMTAIVLVICIGAAIALEIARAPSMSMSMSAALRARLRPLLAGVLVLVAVSGWYYARNKALVGQFAPTAYEGFQKSCQVPFENVPYYERRPPGFFLGWTTRIYIRPFFPTGLRPDPRFFPVLLASTFNDYYVFSYSGGGKYNQDRWVSGAGVTFGCLSVAAGTAIALVTVLAWFGAVRSLWRRREDGELDARFALLLMPLAALLAQLHFATKYPNDNLGPIKGAYMQFVAPVMCALFGLGVGWMWRRRQRLRWRLAALAALAALVFVTAYSVHARMPSFGPNANRAAPFFLSSWK